MLIFSDLFYTIWDTTIAALEHQPSEDLLEHLYLKQLSKCELLAVPLQIYHASVNHQGEAQSYQKRKRMVTIEFAHRAQAFHRKKA